VNGGDDTTDEPVRFDAPAKAGLVRQRQTLYVTFTVVVSLFVVIAAVEWALGLRVFGVDSASTDASGAGMRIEVTYPKVTRGQLTSPFHATVHSDGALPEQITLEINDDYLDLFTMNDISPEPDSQTSTAATVLLTFSPPPTSHELTVSFDLEPKPTGWFASSVGRLSVVDRSGSRLVTASFRTDVRP
jgi:hypothetical protein